jgi:hypothetical protein
LSSTGRPLVTSDTEAMVRGPAACALITAVTSALGSDEKVLR